MKNNLPTSAEYIQGKSKDPMNVPSWWITQYIMLHGTSKPYTKNNNRCHYVPRNYTQDPQGIKSINTEQSYSFIQGQKYLTNQVGLYS